MNLFTPRMLRSFAFGFLAGAIAVAAVASAAHSPDGGRMVPSAVAAPVQ